MFMMGPHYHHPEFDRITGALTGATLLESAAVLALRAGSKMTQRFGHRGHSIGCKAVACVAPHREILVHLNEDAVFSIPFADGYWSRLLNQRHSYEEEIEFFLKRVADVEYSFLDCGANFGYWSILVTSDAFGSQQAIAIEASPANAARLEANAALNGNRFVCINAAVGREANGFVRIEGYKHEAFSTVPLAGWEPGAVRVVSLDSLVEDQSLDPRRPIVVKLDVEGVEIDAVRGAGKLVAGNSIVICEEHGSDHDHRITRHLMNETAMKVFVYDPALRRFLRILRLSALDRIKRYPWVGYNVFATASAFWEQRLLSAR
jgi:FkbM family methyltransferase